MMKKSMIFLLACGVCASLSAQDGGGDTSAIVIPSGLMSAAPTQDTVDAAGQEVQVAADTAGNELDTLALQAPPTQDTVDAAVQEVQIAADSAGNDSQLTADAADEFDALAPLAMPVEDAVDTTETAELGDTDMADGPAFVEETPPSPVAEPLAGAGKKAAKPKIAVYVTGGKDVAENKALGTYILEALVKSDLYVAIERSEAFLAEIDNEQIIQRSGAVDDTQISRLGKQSGVQFVCVADITQILRGALVSARVLDVETAVVATVATAESPLRTMEDLKRVSNEVVYQMLGITQPRERRVRFAGRVAYGNSHVGGYYGTQVSYDEDWTQHSEERRNRIGIVGSGFEMGVSTIVGITDGFSVDVGTNFVWRRPISIKGMYDVTEWAVTVPALLRFRVFEGQKYLLYLQGGAQLDMPVNTVQKFNDGSRKTLDVRTPVDAGLIVGGGWQFLKSMSADIRVIHGLRSFDDEKNHIMYHASVGVSYMY